MVAEIPVMWPWFTSYMTISGNVGVMLEGVNVGRFSLLVRKFARVFNTCGMSHFWMAARAGSMVYFMFADYFGLPLCVGAIHSGHVSHNDSADYGWTVGASYHERVC